MIINPDKMRKAVKWNIPMVCTSVNVCGIFVVVHDTLK